MELHNKKENGFERYVHVLIPLFFTTKCSTQSESKKAVMEKLEHWCMYSEGIVLCMRTAYLTNMPTA